MSSPKHRLIWSSAAVFLSACGAEAPPTVQDLDAGVVTETVDAGEPVATGPCEPVPPSCQEELPVQLRFSPTLAPGGITNSLTSGDWYSEVDSAVGGFRTRNGYVYARFDRDRGLLKTSMTDLQAISSMDWDIAFRRFTIRVNSGDSGPSCVKAARARPVLAYEEVAAGSDAVQFRTDDFFTRSCQFIPDGSGLEMPDTVMSGYFAFGICVKMTGHVYVLELRDGHHVKVTITGFYAQDDQARCQLGEQVSFQTSGRIQLRWSFLD